MLEESAKEAGRQWLGGASLAAIAAVLALPAPLALSPVTAQAQAASQPGDPVEVTGAQPPSIVYLNLEGVVLTLGGDLVVEMPLVGAEIPDPANANATVLIASVIEDPVSGEPVQVVLEDGRTVDVVRDVSGQFLPSLPEPPIGGFSGPLAPPNENRNFFPTPSLNGSNGAKGEDAGFIDDNTPGSPGSAGKAFIRTITRDIEAIGGPASNAFRDGIVAIGKGGNGGRGGGSTVTRPAGERGGNGGTGSFIDITSGSTIATGPIAGRHGIYARSAGGNGGKGSDGAITIADSKGGNGGTAGAGGRVNTTTTAASNITTYRRASFGIYAQSVAGQGGNGGDGGEAIVSNAGTAGNGNNGGFVTVENGGEIHTFGDNALGILGQSVGGGGGSSGDAGGIVGFPAAGGSGGNGGKVELTNALTGLIHTRGDYSVGILAQSIGGGGGNVGSVSGIYTGGASAGGGRNGGEVKIFNDGFVITEGEGSHAILVESIGGGGGNVGRASGAVTLGSSGGAGGKAQPTTADNSGIIQTFGENAHGILAQAIGGGGGNAGVANGLVTLGGNGGVAGSSAKVTVDNSGRISTFGVGGFGLLAQSVGGGGGNAGLSQGDVSIGGEGGRGGDGGEIEVSNTGTIETSAILSTALLAQSIGGGGGVGGTSGGRFAAFGGSGGDGGDAKKVDVDNSGRIITLGDGSFGIVAQAVGGGGGVGGSAGSMFAAIGGEGGKGGKGATVELENSGAVFTAGSDAHAILAQSVGGGGGAAGSALSISPFIGVSIGGQGGDGGDGGMVDVDFVPRSATIDGRDVLLTPLLVTEGDRSAGLVAQSVGGGGGSGGASTQITAGAFFSASISLGGAGGKGGMGKLVTVDGEANILTSGDSSQGILAQSVGGGGGVGGASVAVSGSLGLVFSGAVSVALGGDGGLGGKGGQVDLDVGGTIHTTGFASQGILAQSVGGGGGAGGFSVSAALAGSDSFALTVPVGIGGTGGNGGVGDTVMLVSTADISTIGDSAQALLAQSVGGGGGAGGFNVSGSLTATGVGSAGVVVGLGGSGGVGAQAGDKVTVDSRGTLSTEGDHAAAFVAQSVGGGGGAGGFNISAAISGSGGIAGAGTVGFGGAGGAAGNGGEVDAAQIGAVTTMGDNSHAILAQSLGGGGGAGGLNVSGSLAIAQGGALGVAVGFGGSGGAGGTAKEVNLRVNRLAEEDGGGTPANLSDDDLLIRTFGDDAVGVIAQSIGGGGGAGGINVSGAISGSPGPSGAISFGRGGAGAAGGEGGVATANITANIFTEGNDAQGVLVQSLGGGGGAGGLNVAAGVALGASGAGSIGVGMGGVGGAGARATDATLDFDGSVQTLGDFSTGILVQSVGGGGGAGGTNIAGALTISSSANGSAAVGLGGRGGDGGAGGVADATIVGDITTFGDDSGAIVVQSLSEGGGNGGVNVSAGLAFSGGSSGGLAVGVGGFGGDGAEAMRAELTYTGDARSAGARSDAILVQSVGGGGGNGGVNVAGALTYGTSSVAPAIGIGGFGGDGAKAGDVVATVTGDAIATGLESDAIVVEEEGFLGLGGQSTKRLRKGGSSGLVAQSIGGGGGNGGVNVSGGIGLGSPAGGKSLAFGLGGRGGIGASAGQVTLTATEGTWHGIGDEKVGVLAQSVGGGGGNGGVNVSAGISIDGAVAIGIGGFGGDGGEGKAVTSTAIGNIFASGDRSVGFLAQSIGGGGGNGAVNVSGGIVANAATANPSLVFGMGGSGGDGNSAGAVIATQSGLVMTEGVDTVGVFAQSIGGGGGMGGVNVSGNLNAGRGLNVVAGIGGSGGDGAFASSVLLSSSGDIQADGRGLDDAALELGDRDDGAIGVLAQSIGGGGGIGDVNITGAGSNGGSAIGLGVGGSGGDGANSETVTLLRGPGIVRVLGDNATGVQAQSIGGGGGRAGFNVVLSATLRAKADAQFALGGSGGDGAEGRRVVLSNDGDILVDGEASRGLVAQSIGGGGGSANVNLNASFVGNRAGKSGGASPQTKTLDLIVGGTPGEGANGGQVDAFNTGMIEMAGDRSIAFLAQSIGGGGGDAVSSYSENFNDSSNVSLSIGREGGEGGFSRAVFARNSGTIRTTGSSSNAMQVQSIGGGGGSSDTTTFSVEGDRAKDKDSSGNQRKARSSGNLEVSIGLDGTNGAVGGSVDVINEGLITTLGDESFGIFAQSVGGGGGTGGSAQADLFQNLPIDQLLTSGPGGPTEAAYSLAFQMGGEGGKGGASSRAKVTNRGMVLTSGDESHAIFAQSVGGGGGEGGLVADLATPSDGPSRAISVGLGGDGGEGGVGGAAEVINEGVLQTAGDSSHAIFAQSVGGGGGSGGLVANFRYQNNRSGQDGTNVGLNYSMGGAGGKGNAGGEVRVTNGAIDPASPPAEPPSILTVGTESHGIFAQSVGGGGGSGGAVLSLNVTEGADNATLAIAVGGEGGEGGIGGSVDVLNASLIETRGDRSYGILAQSVGGGGGVGGAALIFNAVAGPSGSPGAGPALIPITVGGNGGNGENGGDVTVTNTGTIVTRGQDAHGIVAQSVGGGGGNANLGLSASEDNAVFSLLGAQMGLLLGSEAGDGGEGGSVTVNHSGDILTTGKGSRAVLAQSIDGGGGGISLDLNNLSSVSGGPLFIVIEGAESKPIFTIEGGGREVFDSTSERVTLNLTGTMRTEGALAAGVDIHAIGGGGGETIAELSFVDAVDGQGEVLGTDFAVTLGGTGGARNHGGSIDSEQQGGDVLTIGDYSPGLFLQSIGGGGGRTFLTLEGPQAAFGAFSAALGGTDISDSRGGAITYRLAGSAIATGEGSIALLAQSIGGGGGRLFIDFTAESASAVTEGIKRPAAVPASGFDSAVIRLGADGGTGLEGEALSLIIGGGVANVSAGAPAIVAQSIGGGGGIFEIEMSSNIAVEIGGSNGAQGDGGDVGLTVGGMIMSEGDRAPAVVVQSIGGGGGAVFGDTSAMSLETLSGGAGNGGSISLDLAGPVAATGDDSVAVLAQSVGGGGGIFYPSFIGTSGGTGSGGAITLAFGGDVMATGVGGIAVRAISTGLGGGGNITITTVADTMIYSEGDAAILLEGGASNLIDNAATIMTAGGIDGMTVRAGIGDESIRNSGFVIGAVDLGSGTNSFLNLEGGMLLSGSDLTLGDAGTLTNQGIMAPGTADAIMSTAVSGNFAQSATGALFTELDLATSAYDSVDVTGDVTASGLLDVSLLNTSDFTPGELQARILTGGGDVSADNLELRADGTVVLGLQGLSVEADAISVNYLLTFAPEGASANAAAFGGYLDRVQTAGVVPALQPTFDTLIAQTDLATYLGLVEELGGIGIYAEQDAQSLLSALGFAHDMRSCGGAHATKLAAKGDGCAWISGGDSSSDSSSFDGGRAIDGSSTDFAGGAHYALGGGWSVGLAVGFSDQKLSGERGEWSASSEALRIGGGLRRALGGGWIGLHAGYSDVSYDTSRALPMWGSSVSSKRDASVFTAELDGGYRLELGSFSVTPALSAGIADLGGGAATETGPDTFALAVERGEGSFAWIEPSVAIEAAIALGGDWQLRPFASAGLRQLISGSEAVAQASFAVDGSGVETFAVARPLGETTFIGSFGFAFSKDDSWSIGAAYSTENASGRDAHSLSAKVTLRF